MLRIVLYSKDTADRCWLTDTKYRCIRGPWPHGRIHMGCNFDDDEVVRHLCSEARCINPIHMKGGTHRENANDRMEKYYWTMAKASELIKKFGVWDDRIEDIVNAMYADMAAYRIKELRHYGYLTDKHEKLAEYVWNNVVATCNELIIVDNYIELMEVYDE